MYLQLSDSSCIDWGSSCGDVLVKEILRGSFIFTQKKKKKKKCLNCVLTLYSQTGHISKLTNFNFIGPVVITGLETALLVMALTPLHTVE